MSNELYSHIINLDDLASSFMGFLLERYGSQAMRAATRLKCRAEDDFTKFEHPTVGNLFSLEFAKAVYNRAVGDTHFDTTLLAKRSEETGDPDWIQKLHMTAGDIAKELFCHRNQLAEELDKIVQIYVVPETGIPVVMSYAVA